MGLTVRPACHDPMPVPPYHPYPSLLPRLPVLLNALPHLPYAQTPACFPGIPLPVACGCERDYLPLPALTPY